MTGRRKSIAVFVTLGVCLVATAAALNVGWIVVSWRTGMMVVGVILFAVLITGLVLNSIFLIREIRRNEQQDHFLRAVTHELKTPVASIRLYLQTLQSRESDEAKRREFYDIMLADTDRLMNTIEQLLRAGQVESSVRRRDFAPTDLREVVHECLDLARTRHHLQPEAIACRESLAPEEPASLLGDPEELKAAVLNLLDNAVKYSKEQVRVLVEIFRPDPKSIAVRVQDNGVGIPPEELKTIFKRFYRIGGLTRRRVKGTGLGLFIVRSIARRHGGKVWAESEGPGRGSTFTLSFPSQEVHI